MHDHRFTGPGEPAVQLAPMSYPVLADVTVIVPQGHAQLARALVAIAVLASYAGLVWRQRRVFHVGRRGLSAPGRAWAGH